jgi:hypothetical protein
VAYLAGAACIAYVNDRKRITLLVPEDPIR